MLPANLLRLCLSFLTLFVCAAPGAAEFTPAARQFLDAHCADCHDSTDKKGGLDLTALKSQFSDAETFAMWLKVHDHIKSGEMPECSMAKSFPVRPRPDWISSAMNSTFRRVVISRTAGR